MNKMFEGVSVNDKVWSVGFGWGEVTNVHKFGFRAYFGGGERMGENVNLPIDFDGIVHGERMPSVFWGEAAIAAPDRPKRTVKKPVWINLYSSNGQILASVHNDWRSARHTAENTGFVLVVAHKIEIEVPE